MKPTIVEELERDMSPEVAAAFTHLAVEYLADTRDASQRVTTRHTPAELAERFGPRIAELVGWVTIPDPGPGQNPQSVKEASLRGLSAAPRDAVLVKLADRASNVQTLRNLSDERQRTYYAQTVAYIVPLAAANPWFASWYKDWQSAHADLADAC